MSPKILIIDDEPHLLKILKRSLELNEYIVEVATDGKIGIELAVNGKPEAILLDIGMREFDGWQTLEFLKTNPVTKKIPVIMFTGKGKMADVDKSFTLGASDYIIKPFNLKKLQEKLEKVINSEMK